MRLQKPMRILVAVFVLLLSLGSATLSGVTVKAEDSDAAAQGTVSDFVTRLYNVCLNRDPDEEGKADWVSRLESGEETGSSAAYGFIFSAEFQNYNYCNTDYVKQLYRAFMGREYDEEGLNSWVAALESGSTREEVFNGFSQSDEFRNLCGTYGITLGDPIAVPEYGTVPHGSCSVCGETDGVTAFVTRLYNICLDREPDEAGLEDWTSQLWAYTKSGRDVAYGFIFSEEFINKDLDDETYVEYLYLAFFDREPDEEGKADWLNHMESMGYSREDVFDGFVGSTEFDNLCKKYGIVRDVATSTSENTDDATESTDTGSNLFLDNYKFTPDQGVIPIDAEENEYSVGDIFTHYTGYEAVVLSVDENGPIASWEYTCDHNWVFDYYYEAPTCSSGGTGVFHCTICGMQDAQPVDATGDHDFVWSGGFDGSCMHTGIAEYRCSVCGYSYTETVDINPNNHDWWTVDGVTYCAECGLIQE
ncbi:MAG: DUF4214 domain-containing protein [Lachnospiraceae bacterium]|nr:DUF4214 domain-containing protein [Lachnospiraceae bacterium]